MDSARFLVYGHVQGVFYRASTREQALRLDLSGYAKNLADGSVEVLACGDVSSIDQLEKWLWKGSSAARVDEVRREDAGQQRFDDFSVV